MQPEDRHMRAARAASVRPKSQHPTHDAIDPNAIIGIIEDGEKLIGWKQLAPKARLAAIATLVSAIAGLVTAIVTAAS